MSWMAGKAEVRREPARVLPGARSVLCVALQYGPASDRPGGVGGEPDGDLWPRVARYARGRDYHELMGRRLAGLAQRSREAFPGCAARPYVDTGPVLERELAARAGLGAVGKHTNLLHPDAGSYFLLGELFTTLGLAPDPPLADLCGSCTRCLTACPTGALPEPYRLDSNRCISYWTIEHRGPLPAAARRLVADWVFGCDLCQEACPWNTVPAPATDPALRLPPERAELDLASLLLLDRAGYVRRFRGSPMKRAKLQGLKRNAAVAMGNRGDPRHVPALGQALADPDPLVRRHAAWALGRIGGPAALGLLEAALATEPDREVHGEIRAALAAG
jgi:epoxyqueuosine reductase